MRGIDKIVVSFAFILLIPAFWTLVHGTAAAGSGIPEPELRGEAVAGKTDDQVLSAEGFTPDQLRLLKEGQTSHTFQAEVKSLMKIIIGSLYSNRDVFLREVISNASDALDKIRFLSLTDKEQLRHTEALEIKIKVDKENNALHITDTGLGMTKDDLVSLLGTIAKSGTSKFLEAFEASGDTNMIGQFGVGFYSVFLVADTVTVTTKHNDDDQYVWQSDSQGTFTVSKDPRGNTLKRGTQLTLHMKEDAEQYLETAEVRRLVQKYSEFISYPIYLWEGKDQEKQVPLTPEELEAKRKEKEAVKQDADETEEVALDGEEKKDDAAEAEDVPTTKTVTETVFDWALMNETKPLWTRPSKDITEQEYNDFYKAISRDHDDPMYYTHFHAEGEIDFKALLYIPKQPPQNQFDPSVERSHKGIKLYIRRVFITDEFNDILPKYLTFIKGVVDSDDLPLNVSREMLQEHKILKVIKKKLVRKAIGMIQELANDKENRAKFEEFWKHYGTNMKLGLIEDGSNRTRLSKILMFQSSKTDEPTTLSEYVERMRANQTQIYYLAGESLDAIKRSPLLERLERKGFEVLYLTDAIDEYALSALEKFDGKYKVTNIAKEGMKLDGEESDEEKVKQQKEEYEPLIKFLKKRLRENVSQVLISSRLTSSPAILVAPSHGYTANMGRIIKAQALGTLNREQMSFSPKKIMEINVKHPIVREMLARVIADENDAVATDTADLVYDTAALLSGYSIEKPAEFAMKINRMINLSLNLDANAAAELEPEAEADAAEAAGSAPPADDAPPSEEEKDEL